MINLLQTTFIAATLVTATPTVQNARSDLDQLQGHWAMVESTNDGKRTTEKQLKIERTIEGSNYTLVIQSDDGERVVTGTIKIDPKMNPKSIDATRTNGPEKGKAMLGIYELKGDQQKVCFAPTGKARPTEFASKQGSGWVLTVWRRVKE
jgi:uncharacterized protein (TIGR03067 family)